MLPKKQFYSSGAKAPKIKLLEKKVPENPKYKHVKPVVDSGISIRKHIDSLRESHRNNVYRMDEVFHRVKLSTFVRLAVEVANHFHAQEACGDIHRSSSPTESQKIDETAKPPPLTPFQSVLVGIGEMDLQSEQKNLQKPPSPPPPDVRLSCLPYLLLDVRCRDDYFQCHIITAKNYPYTMLSRSPGYETKDLLFYKNVADKIIILYDDEENLSPRVATTLVQRGYDNIYLLTGGLKLATEKFPDGLINGTVPAPLLNVKSRRDQRKTSVEVEKYSAKDMFTEDDICKLKRAMDLYSLPIQESSTKEPKEKAKTATRKLQLCPSRNPPWK